MPAPGTLPAEAPRPRSPRRIRVLSRSSPSSPAWPMPSPAAGRLGMRFPARPLRPTRNSPRRISPGRISPRRMRPHQRLAAAQPGLASHYSPAPPETAPPAGISEDAGPLRLVRIGAEADDEPWPEDPWLPGSRRPDRRALIIGVVVIAGLLAVASTAWLVGVNPPQASSPHGTHLSQPSQLGSGHAQPSQALSGQPAPSLTQPSHPRPSQPGPSQPGSSQPAPTQPAPTHTGSSQPAPTHTGTGPARPGRTGYGQSGHGQAAAAAREPARAGRGTAALASRVPARRGRSARDPASPERVAPVTASPPRAKRNPATPASGQSGSGHNNSGHSGSGQSRPSQSKPGQSKPAQSGPGQAGSGPSRTGQSGTGHATIPATPHPRRSAPASRGGGTTRHSHPGVVSITPGLAGRADARRVGGLLVRYFAAVNHRRYQAYGSLFAQRRQLTPREFAWGYRTSHDSNAVLVGIAALKGGLKATVTFTSHQDPAQSPDHSSCIDWRITLFLHRAGATYLIGMPPSGYRPVSRPAASPRSIPRQGIPASGPPSTRLPHTGVPSTGVPGSRVPSTGVPGTRLLSTGAGSTVSQSIRSDRRRRDPLGIRSSGSILAGCWM